MDPRIDVLLWIVAGFLFGMVIFLTVVSLWLVRLGRSEAKMTSLTFIGVDIILVVFFFIWPGAIGADLRFLTADYCFFGGILAALAFFGIWLIEALRRIRDEEIYVEA